MPAQARKMEEEEGLFGLGVGALNLSFMDYGNLKGVGPIKLKQTNQNSPCLCRRPPNSANAETCSQ